MEIGEQVEQLKRGTAGIIPQEGLRQKLEKAGRTGKPLKIKLGLDPTAPDIHLGFAVVLRKLRQFQDLGHEVILIIGDFTALIGDPSGRSATRPMLTREQIEDNARTYVDQLSIILDRNRTTVRFNSEWLEPLQFADLIRITSFVTVARILEREDFARRLQENRPISMHEILYPLAQAYDSVAIEADIELGGTDQTFNILMGRDLQTAFGQVPQVALFTPLLVGLDGEKKMSKSLGNYVGISEPPTQIFGKIMSISDSMMETYFELATEIPIPEVHSLLQDCRTGRANPKDVKRRLAREIVSTYHGEAAALDADEEFERVHAQHGRPAEIPEFAIPQDRIKNGKVWICGLIAAAGLAKGSGDARRLIEQGGVQLNGERVKDPALELSPEELDGTVIQVGRRQFSRIRRPI